MTQQYSSPPEMTIDPSTKYTGHHPYRQRATCRWSCSRPMRLSQSTTSCSWPGRGFIPAAGFTGSSKTSWSRAAAPRATAPAVPAIVFRMRRVPGVTPRGPWPWQTRGPTPTAASFSIVHGDDVGLPPNYTIFGMLTEGLDVLDALATFPVGGRENPRPRNGWESLP